jgi:ChrR Cupin-like domain
MVNEHMITAVDPDEIERIEIGPGCYRRDLPTAGGVRIWIVEIEPGGQWPFVDQHDELGEEVLVLEGELLDDGRVFGPGTYLLYGPNSRHQPRTETGVRLYGINVAQSLTHAKSSNGFRRSSQPPVFAAFR